MAITYTDKDKNAIDGVRNKWRDVDANEVKTVVNTHLGQKKTDFSAPNNDDYPTTQATKSAIDEAITTALAQKWKTSVKAATVAALPNNTQVGTTLVGNINGAFPAQDGIAIGVGESVLIKNEPVATKNGIYTLTTAGDGASQWVLTRRADSDSADELESASVPVEQGTTQADTTWRQTSDSIILGTTSINWVNMGGSPLPDWDDTTKGKVERAIQSEAESAADANVNNRDNTRGLTPRSGRWLVDKLVVGKQDLFFPASGMWPRATNGCEPLARTEISAGGVNIQTLNFDKDVIEYAQFCIAMPRNWNLGTITARFKWTAASGSGDVVWDLKALALSDNDAYANSFGVAQSVTDTLVTANTQRTTGPTGAITIANTPADLDTIYFEVSRVATNVADTLAADAKLEGIFLTITTDAPLAE